MVALNRQYNVYVVKLEEHPNKLLQPVEKISLYGVHKKVVIFHSNNDLFCLIGNQIQSKIDMSSTLRLYEWRQSHFTISETLNIASIDDIKICESNKIVMIIKYGQERYATSIEIYKVFGKHLKHVQDLYLHSLQVHTFSFEKQCFILASYIENNSGTRTLIIICT